MLCTCHKKTTNAAHQTETTFNNNKSSLQEHSDILTKVVTGWTAFEQAIKEKMLGDNIWLNE